MKVVNNQKTYQQFLLDILNSQENLYDNTLETPLKLNIYLALLSLNNNNYKDEYLMTSVTLYYSNSSWRLPEAFIIEK